MAIRSYQCGAHPPGTVPKRTRHIRVPEPRHRVAFWPWPSRLRLPRPSLFAASHDVSTNNRSKGERERGKPAATLISVRAQDRILRGIPLTFSLRRSQGFGGQARENAQQSGGSGVATRRPANPVVGFCAPRCGESGAYAGLCTLVHHKRGLALSRLAVGLGGRYVLSMSSVVEFGADIVRGLL